MRINYSLGTIYTSANFHLSVLLYYTVLILTVLSGGSTHLSAATINSSSLQTPVAINVNFAGSNTTLMANSETAGVVPKTNWNNASGVTSSSALNLVSDQGL